jgi:hypothetical protein
MSTPGLSQRKRAHSWAILGGDCRAEGSISEIKLPSQLLRDVSIALSHRGNRASVGSINEHCEQ